MTTDELYKTKERLLKENRKVMNLYLASNDKALLRRLDLISDALHCISTIASETEHLKNLLTQI